MTIRRGTYDATAFDAADRDVADVVVVGAGPAGSVYAKYLASWGFHVVVLEQGDWVPTGAYTGNRPEYELSLWGRWHKEGGVRGQWQDYPCDTVDSDLSPVMYNAVGGGTIHYGAQWPRLLPSDFRTRTLDGVGDDWPISYEDLLPCYEHNDVDFAVSGMPGDPAYPDGAAPPFPAMPITEAGRRLAQGMNRLGWSWWPAPNAISQGEHRGLVPCARYGVCEAGCPNGSKASVDITHLPSALKDGATIVTGARAAEVLVDERGRASGVVFRDRDDREHRLRAEVVVLAANGIGTPRLMLMSQSARFPNGIANSSGLVGRNLMMHPTGMVAGVWDDEVDSVLGPAGQTVHSYEFYETDRTRGFVRGAKWVALPTGGPLVASTMVPHGARGAHGEELLADVRRVLNHSTIVAVITEDLPDPDNRVTLSDTVTDPSGLPAPKITYRRDRNNVAMLDWHLDKVREALHAGGATTVHWYGLVPDQPGHFLGTARMGSDPDTSVTDSFGRCHDVPNLHLADGSLFVTSGGVNPTNTISALALRGATELVRRAADEEVAAQ